jgi:hypothetical protein
LNGKGSFPKNTEEFDKKESSVEQIVNKIFIPPPTEIITENLFSK